MLNQKIEKISSCTWYEIKNGVVYAYSLYEDNLRSAFEGCLSGYELKEVDIDTGVYFVPGWMVEILPEAFLRMCLKTQYRFYDIEYKKTRKGFFVELKDSFFYKSSDELHDSAAIIFYALVNKIPTGSILNEDFKCEIIGIFVDYGDEEKLSNWKDEIAFQLLKQAPFPC